MRKINEKLLEVVEIYREVYRVELKEAERIEFVKHIRYELKQLFNAKLRCKYENLRNEALNEVIEKI